MTESSEGAADNLTLLDRRVQIIFQDPDSTASFRNGIKPNLERLHRLHGTSLILDASRFLSVGASTFATACTIFHRFYYQRSLSEYDVWSTAMACTLLATKLEEEPKTLNHIIHAFADLYRRRTLFAMDNDSTSSPRHPSNAYLPICRSWTTSQRNHILKQFSQIPLPSKFGPVHSVWHDQISKMESIILRQLGFSLYWIPDGSPHKYILYFLGVLKLDTAEFAQGAWNFCNDSCRLDLCVRFSPEVIACSSIFLAAQESKIHLPSNGRPWWEIFIGNKMSHQVVTAANFILGLANLDQDEKSYEDMLLASTGFVKSLIENNSFNDPESFLWDYQSEVVEKLLAETPRCE